MTSHTPGPWQVVFSRKNGAALRVEAPRDKGVPGAVGVVIRQNGIGMPACGIGKANARLIAAAPDQYRALCEAPPPPENFCTLKPIRMLDWGIAYRKWYDGQRAAAIAKATVTESGPSAGNKPS